MTDIKYAVYKFYNSKNEVIYIGKAKSLRSRINNHNHLPIECYNQVMYVQYTSFENEDTMDFAERYFISKIKPLYNTTYKNKQIMVKIEEFDSAIWTFYCGKIYQTKLKNDEYYEEIASELSKNIDNFKSLNGRVDCIKLWDAVCEQVGVSLYKSKRMREELFSICNNIVDELTRRKVA